QVARAYFDHLFEGSKVRISKIPAPARVHPFRIELPDYVLRTVRAGIELEPGNRRHARANLLDCDVWNIRGNGGVAVRNGCWPGIGSRLGMAGSEAGESDAALCLFCREGDCQHDLQRDYCAGPLRVGLYDGRRPDAIAYSPCADGDTRCRFAAVFRDGTRTRVFYWPELCASDDQPHLFAHVILQRAMGAIHVPAEGGAEDRAGAAAISPFATGTGNSRRGKSPFGSGALGSAARVHDDLFGSRAYWLPARPGKNVWLNEVQVSRGL